MLEDSGEKWPFLFHLRNRNHITAQISTVGGCFSEHPTGLALLYSPLENYGIKSPYQVGLSWPALSCGWKHGAAHMLHHKTPPELENPRNKNGYYHVTADGFALVASYDQLDGHHPAPGEARTKNIRLVTTVENDCSKKTISSYWSSLDFS